MHQSTFDIEAELLIEPDGWRIVSVHFKLEPHQVQPLICEVNRCLHESCAYALVLPIISHCYTDLPNMTTARPLGECTQAKLTDHFILNTGD